MITLVNVCVDTKIVTQITGRYTYLHKPLNRNFVPGILPRQNLWRWRKAGRENEGNDAHADFWFCSTHGDRGKCFGGGSKGALDSFHVQFPSPP